MSDPPLSDIDSKMKCFVLGYPCILTNKISGALCLLLAEHQNRQAKQAKQKTVNPGLPILDEKKPKDALQLFGRIFLVLLFCTLMHFSKGVSPPNKVRIILK